MIDELFDTNEDINESSIQAIEQSPGFVLLHNLDTLLPNENLTLSDDSDNGGSERDTTGDTAKVERVTNEVTSTKYFQILIQYCPRRVAVSKRYLHCTVNVLLQRKNPFVVRNITVFIYTEY